MRRDKQQERVLADVPFKTKNLGQVPPRFVKVANSYNAVSLEF